MYKKLCKPGVKLKWPVTVGKRCIMGILVRNAVWADLPADERGPEPEPEVVSASRSMHEI